MRYFMVQGDVVAASKGAPATCQAWNCGEAYGERVAIVEGRDPHGEWTGPAFQTCVNGGNVARKFESNRRRLLLTFAHHAEVAALPADEADELLDWCLETNGEPHSVQELRTRKQQLRRAEREVSLAVPYTIERERST